MEAEDKVDFRVFHHSFLNHRRCASPASMLFGWLKEKLHNPSKVFPVICEQFGSADYHCIMSIMITSVHDSLLLRSALDVSHLFDRNIIHVGCHTLDPSL